MGPADQRGREAETGGSESERAGDYKKTGRGAGVASSAWESGKGSSRVLCGGSVYCDTCRTRCVLRRALADVSSPHCMYNISASPYLWEIGVNGPFHTPFPFI
eukprot:scaffold17094_cov121-Isochrysis_galbana.AAC.4